MEYINGSSCEALDVFGFDFNDNRITIELDKESFHITSDSFVLRGVLDVASRKVPIAVKFQMNMAKPRSMLAKLSLEEGKATVERHRLVASIPNSHVRVCNVCLLRVLLPCNQPTTTILLRVEEQIFNYVKFWRVAETRIQCIAGTDEPILSLLQQSIYQMSQGEFTIVNLQGGKNWSNSSFTLCDIEFSNTHGMQSAEVLAAYLDGPFPSLEPQETKQRASEEIEHISFLSALMHRLGLIGPR